jgi:hypothetical protein
MLAIGAFAAAAGSASQVAWTLEPKSLARAQAIRAQLDARYRVVRGRGLVFVTHYNTHRPHRSLNLTPPATACKRPVASSSHDVNRRNHLGGLIHEYGCAA